MHKKSGSQCCMDGHNTFKTTSNLCEFKQMIRNLTFSYIKNEGDAGAKNNKVCDFTRTEAIATNLLTGLVLVALAVGTLYLVWILFGVVRFIISISRVGHSGIITEKVVMLLIIRSFLLNLIQIQKQQNVI